jgi:hypothetical protein
MIEAVNTSETSGNLYETTLCNIQKHSHLHCGSLVQRIAMDVMWRRCSFGSNGGGELEVVVVGFRRWVFTLGGGGFVLVAAVDVGW